MRLSITLTLKMSELIYDIQNKTYLTGRSTRDTSSLSHIANMQANDDDENANQILRSITMAAAALRNALSEYLSEGDLSSGNDILSANDNLTFNLKMPSNFNDKVTASLGQAAHQFIVATAIADWFSITAKGETADYTIVAAAALKVIEETLSKRVRPQRN